MTLRKSVQFICTRCLVVFFLLVFGIACDHEGENKAVPTPVVRTENRAPCDNYQPLRQPFFGETHVHTSFSFDAYVFSVRNDPNAAYQFAKGQPVPLPDVFAVSGEPQTRTAQIHKPLDFTAVTDHAELFGEVQICTRSTPDTPGYQAMNCAQIRTEQPNP